jgi:hypothetical protein
MTVIGMADPPLFGLAQSDAGCSCYPEDYAGRRKAVMSIAALQYGYFLGGEDWARS